MNPKSTGAAFLLAAIMAVSPPNTAEAQEPLDEIVRGLTVELVTTSTSTTSTAASVAGLVLTFVMIEDGTSDMETYLQQNAVALQHDLYMGAGGTARDLAHFFGVPDEALEAFAGLLFENRSRLAPLAEPGAVNAASATGFMRIVRENMLRNEGLAIFVHKEV